LEFTLQAESQKIVTKQRQKHNTQKFAEHTIGIFGAPKTPTGVKMTQYKQKIRTVFNKRKAPVGGSLSRLPKPVLKWKNRIFFVETIFPTDFEDGRELYATLMAATG
jgi:hypothetical protein